MDGYQRLARVASSTLLMQRALPGLPMGGTVMVRLVRIAGFGMGNFFEPIFRSLELSEHSFHVLCLLVATESGSAAPSELSEMVGTSRANMTRILKQLEADGWISREVSPRDGRRYVIAITDAGRDKVDDTVPRIAEPIERAFADLSADEMAALDGLLRKLIISFDKGARAQAAAA